MRKPSPLLYGQFLRFIVVGLWSTAINYGLFYLLYRTLGWHYQLSSAAGFFGGVLGGFYLNKNWTYMHRTQATMGLWTRYFAVYFCSLVISLIILYLLVDHGGMDARLANLLAIGVTTVTNFVGTRLWVFRTTVAG